MNLNVFDKLRIAKVLMLLFSVLLFFVAIVTVIVRFNAPSSWKEEEEKDQHDIK